VIIADYELKVFNKDNGRVILNRYITDKELAIKLFNEQVKVYHNIDMRVIITLYDMNKCTNIEYYDTDDNI
jgi:hypothetical protein